MAKTPKAKGSEYKTIWRGINTKTLEVESVCETNDGHLSGRNNHTHNTAGRLAQNEIAIVYSLSDLTSEPAWLSAAQTW